MTIGATPPNIDLLMKRFVHRSDVFVRQWYMPEESRGGYVPVLRGTCPNIPPCDRKFCTHRERVQLTEKHVERHVNAEWTIGIYAIKDNTVKWLLFDVDVIKPSPFNNLPIIRPEEAKRRTQLQTAALAETLQEMRIPFLVEDSGNKGYHLWVFFSEPVQAAKAYSIGHFISGFVASVDGVAVEIFPRQLEAERFGNPVKLPMGIHQKTKRSASFVDNRFEYESNPWGILASVQTISSRGVDRLMSAYGIDTLEPMKAQESRPGAVSLPCMVKIMDQGATEGCRDTAAFRLSCYLRDHGLSPKVARGAMEAWNTINSPPLDNTYLLTKVDGAYQDARRSAFPCQERLLDHFCDPTCRFYESKMKARNG